MRHRTFGPPANAHTDACIRDAARYGFCDHTRLHATTAQLNRATRDRLRSTRYRRTRAALSYLGLALIVLTTVYLARHLPFPAVLWVIPVFSLGWLLVFTCGIPRFLTDTPDDILPPEASRALRDEIT